MKIIKLNERHINTEQIVSISEDDKYYHIRMSNADEYRLDKKANKKLIDEVLGNADIQLSSKRTTERTDRSLQRPTK
jgi:hypothetical protein